MPRPGDAPLVFTFVRELAEYESLLHEVDATEAMIGAALLLCSPAGAYINGVNLFVDGGRAVG